MPVIKPFGIDSKSRVRIKDHQVGVVAHRNRSLSFLKARQARGTFAHPADDVCQSIAARTCFRPHHGKAELQRGDAAPRAQEVAFFAQLHFRRTW